MNEHTVYVIKVQNENDPSKKGLGEASPLNGLSIDAGPDFENTLSIILKELNAGSSPEFSDLDKFPAIRFGLEAAMADLANGAKGIYFENNFIKGNPIPVNGLVWMSDANTMLRSVEEKVALGYSCIKLKVGALDFDEECRLLERIRKNHNAFKVELRLDANGAFKKDDAQLQLKELARFDVHSIEQPVQVNEHDLMELLCRSSKIPIALDEELIGIDADSEARQLLKKIKPQYIILKPTLLGGFKKSDQWIDIANALNIGWWATSALESNVGLNAIAQWVSTKNIHMHQGLGTGLLYSNNFSSPLYIQDGHLNYKNK